VEGTEDPVGGICGTSEAGMCLLATVEGVDAVDREWSNPATVVLA
jgi:hypothetical protein